MAIDLIAEYLKKTTGLDSCSVGISLVEQAVNKRMVVCDIRSQSEYFNLLTNSNNELHLLIDQVMVPETWFFRGQDSFRFLKEYLNKRASNRDFTKLRILTVPCATGEEPYSIAITLTECGFNDSQFIIHAVDIAQESLRMAKTAVFTNHSFRDGNDLIKSRYFAKADAGYKLDKAITKKVTFLHGNIFDLEIEQEDRYDIVFCRNLLIYFDKETQKKAINKIDSLLADDGVLFIGHGEAGCIANSQFRKIDSPNAFAFSKRLDTFSQSEDKVRLVNKKLSCKKVIISQKPNAIKKGNLEKEINRHSKVITLDEATKLADEGKFDRAIIECKKFINASGASADALCLLGIIHDALSERDTAVNYYNRALHLMPDHYQSLMHLASHAERNGDKLNASQYRMKAMRSKTKAT